MYYQKLFNHMNEEHGLILLQTEMDAIISVVNEIETEALRHSCVSDIPCQHKNTIGINQKYDRCKDCGQYLEDYH